MRKIFCYGTLQEPKVQLELIGRIVDGGITYLSGYVVVRDYVDPTDGIAYPRLMAMPDGCVYGRVLEFTDDEVKVLDAYETEMYRREVMELASGVSAEVYLSTLHNDMKGGEK